jgi:dolichol-phosphate mannosyltransferase
MGIDATTEQSPPHGPTASLDKWLRADSLAIGLSLATLLLRLAFFGRTELLPEEAYYWNYSQHLDIGYLDHPPMVAWLIKLGTTLFGDTALGVRAPAVCCNLVASFFIYRLTREQFGQGAARVALALMQVLPFFFLAGTLMTPDSPLTAAWAASLYYLRRALVGGQSNAWWRAGVSAGLGLLSKYTLGLLILAAVIFAAWDVRGRVAFRQRHIYIAALICAVLFAPVIVWNASHEWASFAFQTSRRLADTPQFALHKLVGSVLVLITPVGALHLVLLLRQHPLRRPPGSEPGEAQHGQRFTWTVLAVPLLVFALFSLRHEVKLDWTGAALLAAIPVFAAGIAQADSPVLLPNWLRRAWLPVLLGFLLIYCGGLQYLAGGLPGVGYGTAMELLPVGWRSLGQQVDGIKARMGEPNHLLVVAADRYMTASELAFYSRWPERAARSTSSAGLFGSMGLMYERWFPARDQIGKTLLLIGWSPEDISGPEVERRLTSVGPVHAGTLQRDGHSIRSFYYRVGYGYRAEPQLVSGYPARQ